MSTGWDFLLPLASELWHSDSRLGLSSAKDDGGAWFCWLGLPSAKDDGGARFCI